MQLRITTDGIATEYQQTAISSVASVTLPRSGCPLHSPRPFNRPPANIRPTTRRATRAITSTTYSTVAHCGALYVFTVPLSSVCRMKHGTIRATIYLHHENKFSSNFTGHSALSTQFQRHNVGGANWHLHLMTQDPGHLSGNLHYPSLSLIRAWDNA